jgi:hypothetical protein
MAEGPPQGCRAGRPAQSLQARHQQKASISGIFSMYDQVNFDPFPFIQKSGRLISLV